MRIEKGNENCISQETLVSYEGIIKAAAIKYLGKQYVGWVADVTQDVLLKAWARQDKYTATKGELINWLYTITKNACIDLMNKKGNNVEALVFDIDLASSYQSDAEMRFKTMKYALREAIYELGYRDRTLLVMRYYFKCSGREIAAFLEMPENQVASYMKRAKERLKDLLAYDQAA